MPHSWWFERTDWISFWNLEYFCYCNFFISVTMESTEPFYFVCSIERDLLRSHCNMNVPLCVCCTFSYIKGLKIIVYHHYYSILFHSSYLIVGVKCFCEQMNSVFKPEYNNFLQVRCFTERNLSLLSVVLMSINEFMALFYDKTK